MKKKLLLSALFMVMTMQGAWALSGNGTEQSPWLITSVADWQEFCNSVNDPDNPKTYKGEYVKLTANIGDAQTPAVTKDYMVAKTYKGSPGDEDKYFMGTFDGDGHTLYVNIDGFFLNTAAPFRYLNGATIKNLKTAGTIRTNGYKWRAGIAGVIYGTCTFENCTSAVTIDSYDRSACKSWGGLVAYAKGNVTFSNCVFRGSLATSYSSYPARQIKWDGGGFVGQKDDAVTVGFTNCLVYEPAVSVSVDTEGCYTFINPSGGKVTFTNAYTTMYIGTEQGTLASEQVPPSGAGIYRQTAVNGQACYVIATVSGISRYYPYDGYTHKPVPTSVTWQSEYLSHGAHYNINYSNADDRAVGDYTVTLIGRGGYQGSATIAYAVREVGDAINLTDNASNTTVIDNNNGKTVNVTLKDRTFFLDGKWNTVCLPFDVEISGSPFDRYVVDIRELTDASLSGSTLTLNFSPSLWDTGNASAVSKIEACKPYLIRWLPNKEGDSESALDEKIVEPTFFNVTIVSALQGTSCDLGGGSNVTFTGTYEKLTWNAANQKILILGGDNKLYYPKSGASLGAQRAYFILDGITAEDKGAGTRSIELNFGDGNVTTSIMEVMNEGVKSEKFGADGWFSLDGRKYNSRPTAKGIYINGGKKVVIK